ncbi:hypothetical protein NHQ30_011349 [Ciborinia camelliae]|nr:hypothetical protein NHQ30_011349 [Ciborinia camelliae]
MSRDPGKKLHDSDSDVDNASIPDKKRSRFTSSSTPSNPYLSLSPPPRFTSSSTPSNAHLSPSPPPPSPLDNDGPNHNINEGEKFDSLMEVLMGMDRRKGAMTKGKDNLGVSLTDNDEGMHLYMQEIIKGELYRAKGLSLEQFLREHPSMNQSYQQVETRNTRDREDENRVRALQRAEKDRNFVAFIRWAWQQNDSVPFSQNIATIALYSFQDVLSQLNGQICWRMHTKKLMKKQHMTPSDITAIAKKLAASTPSKEYLDSFEELGLKFNRVGVLGVGEEYDSTSPPNFLVSGPAPPATPNHNIDFLVSGPAPPATPNHNIDFLVSGPAPPATPNHNIDVGLVALQGVKSTVDRLVLGEIERMDRLEHLREIEKEIAQIIKQEEEHLFF